MNQAAIQNLDNSIKYRKEIVYSSFAWYLISNFLKFIPEKIFKKLNF